MSSTQARRQPGPPGVSFRQCSRGWVVHRKAQWVEVKTQPEMDPAFCYFCFPTKVGMALALCPAHPGVLVPGRQWVLEGHHVMASLAVAAGPPWASHGPFLLSRGAVWEAELKVLLCTRHRHSLAAVILSRNETASLAFGKDELVARRAQGAHVSQGFLPVVLLTLNRMVLCLGGAALCSPASLPSTPLDSSGRPLQPCQLRQPKLSPDAAKYPQGKDTQKSPLVENPRSR